MRDEQTAARREDEGMTQKGHRSSVADRVGSPHPCPRPARHLVRHSSLSDGGSFSDVGLFGEPACTLPATAAPPDAYHYSLNMLLCVNFARNSRIANDEILGQHPRRGFRDSMLDG